MERICVEGAFACETVELDLHANANRERKIIAPPAEPEHEPRGLDPLGDLEREHYGDGGPR